MPDIFTVYLTNFIYIFLTFTISENNIIGFIPFTLYYLNIIYLLGNHFNPATIMMHYKKYLLSNNLVCLTFLYINKSNIFIPLEDKATSVIPGGWPCSTMFCMNCILYSQNDKKPDLT